MRYEDLMSEDWYALLRNEFGKNYFSNIVNHLKRTKEAGIVIRPETKNIFRAFKETPFYKVKGVFLGQDPYPTNNYANGLCFDVEDYKEIPASLFKILQVVENDSYEKFPPYLCWLKNWTSEGILMLNRVLTVEEYAAGSHSGIGWEDFTDKVIKILNEHKQNLVFILVGSPAHEVEKLIDREKHFVIKVEHPAKAAREKRLWYHNDCFNKANQYLQENKIGIIDWSTQFNLF